MMRSTILFIFYLFASSVISAQGDDPSSTFEQGVDAYQKDNYQDASRLFEQVLASGQISEDLFFNLGNTYLQNGEIAKAILNYEKALLINRSHFAAQQNLIIANERIINPLTHIPDFILVEFWRNVVNSLGSSSWILIHILCLLIALFSYAVISTRYLEGLKDRLGSTRTIILIGLAIFLSIIAFLAASQRQDNIYSDDYVVIMNEDTPLKDGPDDRSNEITLLSAGVKGRILDQIDNWYKIQMDDKDEGWLTKDQVGIIKL